ncbi:unnamed protein product [Trichobilharzia regenti]|nr:unnamed protein product [Trichobilharzia regenti]
MASEATFPWIMVTNTGSYAIRSDWILEFMYSIFFSKECYTEQRVLFSITPSSSGSTVLVNFKESYEKIKNFIVKLPQFLSFYEKEFNLPASVESIDPVSNVIEEAEQFTRVLENIPKGVKSAKRIMAASQKLHNGLQRILKVKPVDTV